MNCIKNRTILCRAFCSAFLAIACLTPEAAAVSVQPESSRKNQVQTWLSDKGIEQESIVTGMFEETGWGAARVIKAGLQRGVLLFVFDWPTDGVLFVPDLGGEIERVALGGGNLPWRGVDDGLLVGVPVAQPGSGFSVIQITLSGEPVRYEPPKFVGPDSAFLEPTAVELQTRSGLEVRYTLDGTTPGPDSVLYDQPIPLDKSMQIRARSYFNGRPVSAVVTQQFTRYEAWPARALGGAGGLIEETFDGNWDTMPDFSALKPTARRIARSFGLPSGFKAEYIGLRQRGVLRIDRGGLYRFALTSDDGSRLWIDGHLVVDNDGLHGAVRREGSAALAAGGHDIVLEYFNKTGGFALKLEIGVDSEPYKPISGEQVSHSEQGDRP